MGETIIDIKSEYTDAEFASELGGKLKAAAEKNDDLGEALNLLFPSEPPNSIFDESIIPNPIYIESVEAEGKEVFISCYGGRHIEQPIWFVGALNKLGAERTEITSRCDDSYERFYFLADKRSSKKRYFGIEDSPRVKPDYLASLDQKQLDKMFLPEGRVCVRASLKDSEIESNEWNSVYILRMQTEDGKEFYY